MNSFAVGFGTSLPLLLTVGPIAVMLFEHALVTGARRSIPAGLAVAGVDLVWGGVALVAGTALQRLLSGQMSLLNTIAGLVLLGLAVDMGLKVWRSTSRVDGHGNAPTPQSPLRVARRFAAVCAFNPLTVLAFVTLALTAGRALSPMWVAGIAAASLMVHGGWVLLGGGLGRALPPRAVLALRIGGVASVAFLGLSHL